MRLALAALALAPSLAFVPSLALGAAQKPPQSAIVFVADGMRGIMVDPKLTPNMAALAREGASFPNSHSVFPTVTTANSSAIATGHQLGDTGNFANNVYVGEPMRTASGERTLTPFLEDDVVLGEMDSRFGGDYLTETTLLAAARARGFSTAAIGKIGAALIHDHTERTGAITLVMDDRSTLVNERTKQAEGIPISDELAQALDRAGLSHTPPATDKPNRTQQQYWVDVATKVVLPLFQARGKPFVIVLWMREPDYSQHNQLDSRPGLVPGINGSTSLAAIRTTDRNLGEVRAALKSLGLERSTNLFVTSDHGFSTISKQSETSHSRLCSYPDVMPGDLPPGFMALDIANLLDLPLRDPDSSGNEIDRQPLCEKPDAKAPTGPTHPKFAGGVIGRDPAKPDIVVTAGAGSALVYLTSEHGRNQLQLLVKFLLRQDYTGGLFLDDELGRLPGTIPLSAVNLVGSARTPRPGLVVSFRSFSTGCDEPLRCAAEVADTGLDQGQGNHGSFSRADTFNFMAAVGPGFRRKFVDPAPVGNADVAPTLLRILGIDVRPTGKLTGRVIAEALPGGAIPKVIARTCSYPAAEIGRGSTYDHPPLLHLQPAVREQRVGDTLYLGAAGLVSRTLGLDDATGPCEP